MPGLSSLPTGLSPADIARRMALPLLIFAAVLTSLLLLSWFLVLPRYTAFAVEGKTLAASALPAYERSIAEDIARMVARREELTLPTQDEQYLSLLRTRAGGASLLAERRALESIAAELDLSANIVFSALRTGANATVRVTGDVRGVGLGSMTALARFVDAVAADKGVTHLEPPAFTRETDPVTGPHSPFTFTYRRSLAADSAQ
jgi:hypothetical protein